MASVNKAVLVGNLGKDPTTRYQTNGDPVCTFSVATTDKWKDKATGEQREATEWHNITAFGKLAEICSQYLKKGSQVYIEGKLKTNKYTDKDGVERYATGIIADQMQMLGSKGEQEQSKPAARPNASSGRGVSSTEQIADSDIPF